MWYGSVSAPLELFGPSRYQWDNNYFSSTLETRVKDTPKLWANMPDKLLLCDLSKLYPSKGGLFRSGPQTKGDGIVSSWIGHASFNLASTSLSVRRMPAFFETFPVLLVDQGGTVRADIPFRRAESRYSIEQRQVQI